MTYVNLNPTATTSNTGALTGGATAHAVLADTSDSSYVQYDNGQISWLTMADLTLPSGAQIILAQVMVRAGKASLPSPSARIATHLEVASGDADVDTYVSNWFATDLYTATRFGGLSDADVDGAAVVLQGKFSLQKVRAYRMYLRVLYYLKPTVDVDLPTGTITENVITVTWTPTFDPDAQSNPSFYDLRIFSAAQYGVGGFDPATSPATISVDQQNTQGSNSAAFSKWLADGDYRAYVRVAAGNTPDHKSDWDYNAFTVDAPNPGVPTMTLTAVSASGSIQVDLDDNTGDVTTTSFELQRSEDAGATWADVRTSSGGGVVTPTAGLATVYDYEAPNGVECTYRARAVNLPTPSVSDWTEDTEEWSSSYWWIKHSTRPSLNRQIKLRSYPGSSTAANQGVFRPLGSKRAVIVSDVRGPITGQIVFYTDDLAEREALELSLEAQAPMLLQGPVSDEQPERWVVFGDSTSERIIDLAWVPLHDETLPWTEVDRPTGPLEE